MPGYGTAGDNPLDFRPHPPNSPALTSAPVDEPNVYKSKVNELPKHSVPDWAPVCSPSLARWLGVLERNCTVVCPDRGTPRVSAHSDESLDRGHSQFCMSGQHSKFHSCCFGLGFSRLRIVSVMILSPRGNSYLVLRVFLTALYFPTVRMFSLFDRHCEGWLYSAILIELAIRELLSFHN
jgi:hypothetical protein